ncbi:carbohydrate kinase FGGY [Pseudarthrobacter chlorophenolicus A6]|uniref:Carbohydrate kinase FGGY n=1 Tax=Pseudarthrobacter chlorophenolicus (strain ATCC 700700 / DSM 12829 / CIP 107037 / JCM 12360 / KCTC 9906 / NCIMB 13794 / A6) TaxID=452863 RepID=B8HF98_PSECP|nr:rhamnulokinase family protein [Pseudarthrobacter chlorophenolicus]ACL41066.1 carbohydrate kinase FGGY [Pseudarthrobacter chlorophenolicus A6]SDQ70447.1 rhamnulokinase [Pseudarthrobacter chlorophenolicus]
MSTLSHDIDGADNAPGVFAAVDIGASSGRVMLGRVSPESGVSLETVHRFPNGVVEIDGGLRWNFDALFAEVLAGLRTAATVAAGQGERIASIGIDTWAVDYGLVDAGGNLAAQPFSYRDDRSRAAVEPVHRTLDPERLYATTGLQFLQFNTIYQLATEPDLGGLQALLIPDLIAFLLTGARRTEATNASTTGLFDAVAGEWATEFMAALGLRKDLFPPLIQPGEAYGALLPAMAEEVGLPSGTLVVAVGSHDTASAVAAVPADTNGDGGDFAYVSSGTWSLVGLELLHPVLTEASREANFTNERGVDGTIRYLRNIGGLWLLSECQRTWASEGFQPDLTALLAAAAALPSGGPQINADDPYFIAPDNMPERIRAAVRRTGEVLPNDPAAITRCIMDSLAAGYARTLADAERLADRSVGVVHVVGGGSQNALLCQLTADATRRPVIAGPVEATALGNVLVQARAAGAVTGGLPELRRIIAAGASLRRYEPAGFPVTASQN